MKFIKDDEEALVFDDLKLNLFTFLKVNFVKMLLRGEYSLFNVLREIIINGERSLWVWYR